MAPPTATLHNRSILYYVVCFLWELYTKELQVKLYVHYTNHILYVHYTNIRTPLPDKLQCIHPSLHIPDEPESAAIKVRPHYFKGLVILLQRLGNDITKLR